MRITRLMLERYGHLAGETLEFPDERGLHVVFGANEAGKSTTLEAVADGLWGFGHRTTRDHLHPSGALRVGLTLRSADGREASFVRRKGTGGTLSNNDGAVVPESAIAAFLGGVTRERFNKAYGLDAAQLRIGGAAILTEQGEAGAAILQAQTGLRGLRDIAKRLDDEAKTLHGDGRGARRISAAAAAVKENRRLINERSLNGADYARALEESARLDQALLAIDAEAARLRQDQARLDRIRRTAPVRGVLAQAAQELAALGPPPALPDGAAAQRSAALHASALARHDLGRDEARAAALNMELAATMPDDAVLAEADTVMALANERTHIAALRAARQQQHAALARCQADADRAAAQLGIDARGTVLRDRLPDALTRAETERLMQDHASLSGHRDQAADALADARRVLADAERALAEHPPADGAHALRDAAEAAAHEGRIDDALTEAEADHAAASAASARLLAGLPLWAGTMAQLAAAPPPPDAEVLRLATALDQARAARQAARAALAAHDRALDATRAELHGVAALGALPTADAVTAARASRDRAWRLIRRALTGGPPPTAAELDGLDPDGLPDQMDRLLRDADALADRRLSDAVRVAEWERLCAAAARDTRLRDGLATACHSAEAGCDAAEAAWGDAWRPCGVVPLEPAAMRDWLRDRAAVLAASDVEAQAWRALDTVRDRRARVLGPLQALLPDVAGGVGSLLQAARRQLQALDAATAAHATARAEAAAAQATARKAEDNLRAIDAQFATWKTQWQAVAPRLGLPPTASTGDAAVALGLWSEIEDQARAARAASDRISEMDAAVSRHDAAQASLAARLGEPASDGLLPRLSERLAAAHQAGAVRRGLAAEQASVMGRIADHRQALDHADARLTILRDAAGAADDAGLQDAIARAAEHARLQARMEERSAELHRLDDGKAAAELEAEASAVDIDAIPGALAAITQRLEELDRNRTAQAGLRADCRTRLRFMQQGQDVAGPAQAVQDELAAIEDAAARYVRLRMAHSLLQAGIERYRRSQQGPLLQSAGALFAELTENRYARLDLRETEKGEPVIVAVRPDGTSCPADRLSEGTRDQLFLALRLASIAAEAATSEPLPLLADDLLVNFDDARARAALRVLARFGAVTQVILFTHHDHIARMADPASSSLHHLPQALAAA